jgi:hypothetical protein
MGEHQVISTATEKWHSEPFQPTTRLLRIFRSQSKLREVHDHGHCCKGPSFLHNLLPILEPFLLLDPRLLYVEDRIIGRQQAPRSGPSHKVPSSFEELQDWIRDSKAPCDCDECAPWLYGLGTNSSHQAIRYQTRTPSDPSIKFISPRSASTARIELAPLWRVRSHAPCPTPHGLARQDISTRRPRKKQPPRPPTPKPPPSLDPQPHRPRHAPDHLQHATTPPHQTAQPSLLLRRHPAPPRIHLRWLFLAPRNPKVMLWHRNLQPAHRHPNPAAPHAIPQQRRS